MIDVKEKDAATEVKPDFENELLIAPFVNIFESDNDFSLVADMPGVSKENLNIKYEDGFLSVYGRVEDNYADRKYVLKEISSGSYFRKFKISANIDSEKIEAALVNGQLTIVLPKHDRAKAKTISIK